MRIDKYIGGLKRGIIKRASPGERVLTSLFPSHATGWPGGWSQDRMEQVQHMTRWVYVCANLICSKIASITPNLAYVVDQPKRGVTVKAGHRGLQNLMDRGFGGSTDVGGSYNYHLKNISNGAAYDYSHSWEEISKASYPATTFHPMGPADGGAEFGFSDGGHSWLTMGEYRSKSLSVVKPHEDLEPLESDHPLRRLIENPNPVDTHYDIEYEKWMFKTLCGISYEWTPLNEWGMPAERWCIPSHWMWPRTGGGKYVNPDHPHADEMIQYYECRPWGGMGSAGILYFPPNEIITERYKSPISKIDGHSPLAALAQWIDLDESISKSRWAQMMNQARPELWIELGPGYEDPTDDRIIRLEAMLSSKYQGEYNYGKPIVTPPGAKLAPLSYSPAEMAYEKSGEQTQKMILSGFLVPPSAVGLVDNMTYGSILATLGALCLDERTECLTADGWKKHEELTEDTRIACYDEKSGQLLYRKPSRIERRQYQGPMHQWSGERLDAVMTPGHRVHIQRQTARKHVQNDIPWQTLSVEEMTPTTNYKILRAAPAACNEPEIIEVEQYGGYRSQDRLENLNIDPDTWLRFLGLWLSEGHLRSHLPNKRGWELGISQHPCSPKIHDQERAKARFASIRKGVLAFPSNWKERQVGSCVQWTTTNRGLYEHLERHCRKGAKNKRIPSYVKDWPAHSLRVLLDALIEGDGSLPYVHKQTGVWNAQYQTSSKQLADDVMEIAIKCGLSASVTVKLDQREKFTGVERFVVNLSSRTEVLVCPVNRSVINYTGTVWCVTVPTGLFVVRRNGKAHITGNCAFCINPKLAASGQTQTKHLASRFDEKAPAYSTRNGAGGRASTRRARLWYDDCLDTETECLTEKGWLKYTDLSEDVKVRCYDPATLTFSWQNPTNIVVRDHTGPVHKWCTNGVNAVMTPNHRVLSVTSTGYRVQRAGSFTRFEAASILTVHGEDAGPICHITALDRSVEEYSGKVWCLTVPTGFFVVRRGGDAYVTGNCVPADPQQVNSDIQADLSGYALTPNELRALRGRKPYKHGGDDPLGPGPGGVTPIPLNTGDSLEALAQQLQPMADLKGGGSAEQGPAGGDGALAEGNEAPAGPTNRLSQFEAPEPESVGIAEPNGQPTKYWENGRSRDKSLTW